MTRLSSSQQINNQQSNILNGPGAVHSSSGQQHQHSQQIPSHSSGNVTQIGQIIVGGDGSGATQSNYVTPVPPLSSNVIITGHNKWGIPSTKITSGGVTVTTSPQRQLLRPHSQGPSTLLLTGSNNGFGSMTSCNNSYNITNGNMSSMGGAGGGGVTGGGVAVHHIAPASPTTSLMALSTSVVSKMMVKFSEDFLLMNISFLIPAPWCSWQAD